jgi:hypothetical protein
MIATLPLPWAGDGRRGTTVLDHVGRIAGATALGDVGGVPAVADIGALIAGRVVMELSANSVIGTARRWERARMVRMWVCLREEGTGDRPVPSGWRSSVDALILVVAGARLSDTHVVAVAIVDRAVGVLVVAGLLLVDVIATIAPRPLRKGRYVVNAPPGVALDQVPRGRWISVPPCGSHSVPTGGQGWPAISPLSRHRR